MCGRGKHERTGGDDPRSAQPPPCTHEEFTLPSPTDIRQRFTEESARAKVQAAEEAWNTRD